jgi:small subunit ribosomal protein S7
MSRRHIIKKSYVLHDSKYNSYLVSLFINRILRKGKKRLAETLVYKIFKLITEKTLQFSLKIFKLAIINVKPRIIVKTQKIKTSSVQMPFAVSMYYGIILALRWLIKGAKERSGRTLTIKLANEIIDASNKTGNAIKKCQEMHKLAQINKTVTQLKIKKMKMREKNKKIGKNKVKNT